MAMERRLFVRFLMSGIVIVQPDLANNSTIDCELVNLSYNGIGMFSSRELALGSKIKFIMINRQLNVNLGGFGRVVFCNSEKYNNKDRFRIGIEIIDADREKIKSTLMSVRELPEAK
jgi:hypothetical protein